MEIMTSIKLIPDSDLNLKTRPGERATVASPNLNSAGNFRIPEALFPFKGLTQNETY